MTIFGWVSLKQILRQNFKGKWLVWKVILESMNREVGKRDWERIHPPSVCYQAGYSCEWEGLSQCRHVSVIPLKEEGNLDTYPPTSISHWSLVMNATKSWGGRELNFQHLQSILHCTQEEWTPVTRESPRPACYSVYRWKPWVSV